MSGNSLYRIENLIVERLSVTNAEWNIKIDGGDCLIRGDEHRYAVEDRNYKRAFLWDFAVRVPSARSAYQGIVIRPISKSDRECWKHIHRRSIIFIPAENGNHAGKVYAKITIQDISGARNKVGTRRGERTTMPEWLQDQKWRMKLKSTVKDTRGTDGNAQVFLVQRFDYRRMIWLFFATKIWVAAEAYVLPR